MINHPKEETWETQEKQKQNSERQQGRATSANNSRGAGPGPTGGPGYLPRRTMTPAMPKGYPNPRTARNPEYHHGRMALAVTAAARRTGKAAKTTETTRRNSHNK